MALFFLLFREYLFYAKLGCTCVSRNSYMASGCTHGFFLLIESNCVFGDSFRRNHVGVGIAVCTSSRPASHRDSEGPARWRRTRPSGWTKRTTSLFFLLLGHSVHVQDWNHHCNTYSHDCKPRTVFARHRGKKNNTLYRPYKASYCRAGQHNKKARDRNIFFQRSGQNCKHCLQKQNRKRQELKILLCSFLKFIVSLRKTLISDVDKSNQGWSVLTISMPNNPFIKNE